MGEKASSTRRRNKENFEQSEKGDYVSSGHACAADDNLIFYAGVAELADAQDLGSCVNSCRFKSCYPHHKKSKGLIQKY